jgi:hypothetical protein
MLNSAQALSGSTFFSHAHLHLNARLSKQRLGIPRPTKSLGEATLSYATKHWLPLMYLLPFQRKAPTDFEEGFQVFGGMSRDIIACTGIAHNVTVRPPRVRGGLPASWVVSPKINYCIHGFGGINSFGLTLPDRLVIIIWKDDFLAISRISCHRDIISSVKVL